jgi:hypothetical protein
MTGSVEFGLDSSIAGSHRGFAILQSVQTRSEANTALNLIGETDAIWTVTLLGLFKNIMLPPSSKQKNKPLI